MKTKKAYIVYKKNQYNNDFDYIKEYYDIKEIQEDYKLKNKNSIYHYIKNTIEDNKNLLLNQYLIIKEEL